VTLIVFVVTVSLNNNNSSQWNSFLNYIVSLLLRGEEAQSNVMQSNNYTASLGSAALPNTALLNIDSDGHRQMSAERLNAAITAIGSTWTPFNRLRQTI